MNKDLQYILDFIKNAEHLSEKEKSDLTKSVKNADKELTISEFKLERTEKVKKTTAILLKETIEELEQKRKAVEKHNRELEIETALERVRSRTMGMHKSEELKEVIQLVYEQFVHLNIHIEHTGFIIDYKARDDMHIWLADQHLVPSEVTIPCFDSLPNNSIKEAKEKGQDFFKYLLTFEEKNKFYRDLFKFVPDVPEESLEYYFNCPGLAGSGVLLDNIGLYIENFSGTPYTDEENNILMRFGKVFQQTYTRFLDLQKAEAQARESQIALSLERIRARTMAMQHSDELSETAQVLYQQFKELGENPDQLSIGTVNENEKVLELWLSVQGNRIEETFKVPIDEPTVINKIYTAWKEGKKSVVIDISGDELKKYEDFRNRLPEYKTYNDVKNFINKEEARRVIHCAFFPKGLLSLATPEPRPEETKKLLERFAGVFDLTYTRFLDLKKAEEQAREAEIELGLERVRARAMAMQKSNELSDLVDTVFKELTKLDFALSWCIINIIEESTLSNTVWAANPNIDETPDFYHMKFEDYPFHHAMMKGYKERKTKLIYVLEGDEKKIYDEYLFNDTEFRKVPSEAQAASKAMKKYVVSFTFSNFGGLQTVGEESLSDSNLDILARFGKVFDLTYTRFNDLLKAEAQAREAQIEAALERTRTQSMLMQHSNELDNTLRVFHKQVLLLGIQSSFSFLWLPDEKKDRHIFWAAWVEKNSTDFSSKAIDYPLDRNEPATAQCLIDWKGKEPVVSYHVPPAGVESYFAAWQELIAGVEQLRREYFFDGLYYIEAFMKYGCFGVMVRSELSEEEKKILYRFTIEFERAYTRFLDLQKAEARARESKIEAALERVRAKAMAMHSSDDLAETVDSFFSELNHLNVMPHRCGVGIINSETRSVDISANTATHENEIKKITGTLKLSGHPVLDNIFENWKLQKEYHPVLKGKEIVEYYKVMNPQVEFPDFAGDEIQYGYYFFFKEGGVFAWTEKELSEEDLNIFRRFTSVLSLTYRRYLDLKDAEARAAEAVRQTSLDRVRAEIASMRTTEDLNRITPIIWRELKALEVPFIRCGVFIIDEDKEETQVYLTTPDGKSLGVLNLPFGSNKLTSNTVEFWRKEQVYKEHWKKEEFINWTKSMMKLGQVQNAETYQGSSQPPESLHLHFVPFTQGMLYVGNVSPLDNEKLELVKTLAEAFSIAYARYEDFKNLEEAKGKVEDTLKELKSAQAQLVHSEKMASLGELTAGIAHEIKNPLNFVNNFSEVSSELIQEMKEELEKGNNKDALEIAEDLKQNLEKINHHGKRADSIVKGMLLHSRGTAGEKTPTDINDLLEQYLNLAYHGMRAQNKDFNITIERDYDKSLEKINVVPQDISRVFLNIINNGCYAANDKKKRSGEGFSPTIKVSTKNLNDNVEIRISDNGNGIPDKIKDKLFQPFFTTKPTGEGTGLGLSLSYDIVVKQHGGEIKIESKEGEGAEFVITLPNG